LVVTTAEPGALAEVPRLFATAASCWAFAQSFVSRFESIDIFATWGSQFRNASRANAARLSRSFSHA
jgi:hypothetical protein